MKSYKIHRDLAPIRDIEIHIDSRTLCAILYGLEEAYGIKDNDFEFFSRIWADAYGNEWNREDAS